MGIIGKKIIVISAIYLLIYSADKINNRMYLKGVYMKLIVFLILMTNYAYSNSIDKLILDHTSKKEFYDPKMSIDYKTNLKGQFKSYYDLGVFVTENNEKDDEVKGFLPNDLELVYFKLVQDVFMDGFSNEASMNKFLKDYKKLNKLQPPAQIEPKDFWWPEYEKVINSYISHIENSGLSCAKLGQISTTRKCCRGTLSWRAKADEIPKSCKRVRTSCSSNSECCSGACFKDSPNAKGMCMPTKMCKPIIEIGQKCIPGDFCYDGGRCRVDKVENKKEVFTCQQCVGSAHKELGPNDKCCRGFYKSGNKCKKLQIPLVPIIRNTEVKKSLLNKIVNFIFPIAHAQSTVNHRTDISEAQKDLIKDKTRVCNQEHVLGSRGHEECLASVTRQEEAFKQDVSGDYLTDENLTELQQMRDACTMQYETGTDDHTKCMSNADEVEKALVQANKSNPDFDKEKLNREGYLKNYNIPAVTAKTYSDVKKCEFNSFNDSWRDASNQEKNAETFLRAFEYVFSHEGTQDYWHDGEKGNIFTRANKVAKSFRENRYKMMMAMKEVDRKMACKCIAIFGPTEFSADKQSFFNSKCEEEKAQLQAQLGQDLGKGGGNSKIDGSTLNVTNKTENSKAAIEEMDKGAAAISHEKLLIEWLKLRADAQMDRFVDNSELEKELTELSEFITETNFEEVWKGKIENDTVIPGNPDGNTKVMYKWGYKYPSKLFAILMVVVAIAVSFVFPGAAVFASMGILGAVGIGLYAQSNSKGSGLKAEEVNYVIMRAAWHHSDNDGISAAPQLFDVKTAKKKTYKKVLGVVIKYYDGFDRYFVGPHFDMKNSKDNCKVDARASVCFKSAYRTDFDNQTDPYFIVDPTRPLFVDNKYVKIDSMENGNGKTMPQMINEASSAGYQFLMSLRPTKGLKGGYQNGGKNFTKGPNGNHMERALEKGYFQPLMGKYNEVEFNQDKIKAIIDAAKKYARCKNLIECGASPDDVEENALGFGYLFESDSEALDFAKYAYEIHYKWSHLSANSYMGYPLLGMDEYFQLAAYNMKLVGSLAASRSMQYAETYDLYKADWEKRVGLYDSLGEANLGNKSSNIKYSKDFYDLFKTLDFSGANDLAAFNAKVNTAKSTGSKGSKFNSSELAALNAASKHIARVNKDIEKKELFDKESQGAKDRSYILNQKKKQYAAVNSPLSNFNMKKFGANSGLKNDIAALNKKLDGFNTKTKSTKEVSPITKIEVPTFGGFNGNSSSYSSGQDHSLSNDTDYSKDTGMSQRQAQSLIDNLDKDSSLTKAREGDTLFSRVSKAYKRNYGRVLLSKEKKLKSKKKINKAERSEMELLLESGN